MLSPEDIDTLLHYLDLGIREEIRRICDPPPEPASFESLVTTEDAALAKSMGIIL